MGSRMQDKPAKQTLSSITAFALVAAIIVPMLMFAALIWDRYQLAARLRYELKAEHTAFVLASDIDHEFARLFATGQTLATSPSISSGDFSAFRQQALKVRDMANVEITLSRPGKPPLVDTRLPTATSPAGIHVDVGEEVLRKKQTVVVSVPSQGKQTESSFAVVTPVFEPGTREVAYALALFAPMERFQSFVDPTDTRDLTASILDRRGVKLISTSGRQDIVDRRGLSSDFEKSVGEWSVWKITGIQGQPVYVGYARSKLSDWLVAVDFLPDDLQHPLHRDMRNFGFFGSIALLASMVLGMWAMRRTWKQAITGSEGQSDRGE
jgi:hypothetical protein